MNRRGFSLPVVILSLGVVTVSALVLLDVVNVDIRLLGAERRTLESRLQAEGGLMEMMNDQRLLEALPDYASNSLSAEMTPPDDSMFTHGSASYEAQVRLIRLAPLLESSQSKLQAVVYELVVDAQDGLDGQAGVRAEIYKFASKNNGLIQESKHAR
ncbi:MAG: hypothetical protein ACFB9M_20545 [Myxococcota bacterium]